MDLIINIIFYLFIFLISVEIILKVISFIKNRYTSNDSLRKKLLSKNYHKYLNLIESKTPMFSYLPIGLRNFNMKNNALSEHAKFNKEGFRTDEFENKKENELRIVVLGGSAAWGCGSSSNSTTISGHLEKIIKNNNFLKNVNKNSIKVFNLSQINGTQTQDLLNLIFFYEKTKPDIVISFIGWNEMITSYGMDKEKLNKFKTFYLSEISDVQPLSLPFYKKKIFKKLLMDFLFNNFYFLSLFKEKQKSVDIPKKIKENYETNSQIVLNNLNIYSKLEKAFNFTKFTFLQPNVYNKKNLTTSEKNIIDLYEKHRPIHGGRELGIFLKENNIYNLILNNKDTKSQVFDLSKIFDEEKKEIFFTLVHLNDDGYKIIAQQILEIIKTKYKSS